jgi:HK97 family phage major capsid protein
VEKLKEQLRGTLVKARDIAAKAEAEDRALTAEERQQIEGYVTEAAGLKGKIQQAKDDAEMMNQINALGAGLALDGGEAAPKLAKGVSMGQQFVSSEAWKAWLNRFPGGRVPASAKGIMSPPVEFKDLLTGDDSESAGAFVQTDYTGIYEPLGRHPLNVLGLIQRRRTTSDTVEFVRQTLRVTQAAPVAEANVTTYTGATGEVEGAKPEGTLEFEQVQANVKTIAVWIPATKQALSDAAQIRGIIDGELRDDLMEEAEAQVVAGSGVGANMTGVLNTTGILAQAWDTDLLTTIRRARTSLKVNGRSFPTAIVMHPNDAESLDLLTDSDGRFYFGGPRMGEQWPVWRVPVVESESLTEGTALMGDFRKAVLWDREQATIQVSDSHEDFFTRNMVAILAEMRAAFGVIRPTAFITVAMESGS